MNPAYKFTFEAPEAGLTVLCRLHTGTGVRETMLITCVETYPNGRWTAYGFDRHGDIQTVTNDAKVFYEHHWKPLDWVRDGSQNVYRPPGLVWEKDKFVEALDMGDYEDDGGIPADGLWPAPQRNEAKSDWWKRCKNRWEQLDGRNPEHRETRDRIWQTHLDRLMVA